MNIILTGMPGCGKTTVCSYLSSMLGYEAVDTDEVIVSEYGEISEIFARYGEEYFRNLESEAVKRVCGFQNAVIATGGGCLLREENVRAFRECGKIIYLKTSIEELLKRLKGDDTRPLLKGDAEANLKDLYVRRSQIYEGTADYIVATDGLTPERISKKITELLK